MKRNHSEQLRLLTLTGALAALTAVATLLIRIPTPTKGYINLGDTVVNLAAWILGPVYGAAAAGIGSAAADLIAGYTVYAPVTLVIKALMAAAAFAVYHQLGRKWQSVWARIASAIISEVIMILGYAVFEAIFYGSLATGLLSISGNLVQGIFGAAASVVLYEGLLRHVPGLIKRG